MAVSELFIEIRSIVEPFLSFRFSMKEAKCLLLDIISRFELDFAKKQTTDESNKVR